MRTTEDRGSDASGTPSAGNPGMTLEVVTIPVAEQAGAELPT